ncbi:tripartite tricarboxylate transporter TctB family protein [Clostridium sp. AM58-1XD]|uniref:tripartite tricarboxylate transporter TctB family protein n=1 Tax=Clostridium sp. AM58-1XD TaxID=2292307 RepID=UPI000E4EE2F1|nr:tripartite tricarboxylate transporter TctB family protein [Clostridium sp. AM58-1XD]RGZ01207.1 tripartite tricarboxylate transporter TctB family protein [Clostridium sp. AM58-1XD]
MKNFGTKQVVPVLSAIVGVVFAYVGFTQLGFWHGTDGPMPGFFPSIMSIVMVLASILAFVQSFKEEGKPTYYKEELLVIAGGAAIYAGTFIIGLLPMCYIYVILWLKLFEKESWKNTLIVLAVILAITIGVFYFWLGIQFPMGLLENYL